MPVGDRRGSAFQRYETKADDGRMGPTLELEQAELGQNHTVVAHVSGVFDTGGGSLASEETGVSIIIPPGAIPKGEHREIYFKVVSALGRTFYDVLVKLQFF